MTIDPIVLTALAKFNQNKNAKHFKADLDPGTYPVDLSFHLLGTVSRGLPGLTRKRDLSGSKHIAAFLLDHCTAEVYEYLVHNLSHIRKGNILSNRPERLEERMDQIMPYREYIRQGSTSFTGELIVEDVNTEPDAYTSVTDGLRIVSGE